MPADDRHVLEDAPPECEERDEIQVDAEPVAEECERGREQRVRVEAGEEDPRREVTLELGAQRTQERVERGQDANGRVPGEIDREVDPQRKTEQDTCDKAEERQPRSEEHTSELQSLAYL